MEQDIFYSELSTIEEEINHGLLNALPDHWVDVIFTVEYIEREKGFSLNSTAQSSSGRPLIPEPPEFVYEKVLKHRELFKNYKGAWKSAVFKIFWDETDQSWKTESKYNYENT